MAFMSSISCFCKSSSEILLVVACGADVPVGSVASGHGAPGVGRGMFGGMPALRSAVRSMAPAAASIATFLTAFSFFSDSCILSTGSFRGMGAGGG